MNRLRSCVLMSFMVPTIGLLSGCLRTSTPAPPKTSGSTTSTAHSAAQSTASNTVASPADVGGTSSTSASSDSTGNLLKARPGFWEDYPDVPKIEVMTEVEGIKIPRMKSSSETLKLAGPIPVDVDNAQAKLKPSKPTTGDHLTIRFSSEPKVLNQITENSAVKTYILQYVSEALVRQNNETFEFEPGIAKKWIVEDSVKLSPEYPGRERRLVTNGAPQSTIEIDYVLPPPKDGKPTPPPVVKLKTTDKDGKPMGRVWIGVYPIGRILGASTTGYHEWSDTNGDVEIGGYPSGKYTVKTGDEIFGLSKAGEDGSLVVTPGTPENPLKEPMTLKAGEWQDVQAKTYTTFYLRDDVKWSDGAPFTTKDIEFGYALLNNNSVDGDSLRTYYNDLVECTAHGPHIVRLRYRQQYFMSAEFSYGIAAYCPAWHFFEGIFKAEGRELTLDPLTPEEEASRKQISARGKEFGKFFNTDERYNSNPLGTGPYKIDKWYRTDRVELVRNQDYWDQEKAGHVDRIIVKFIPDQVTALAALKQGEIDFFYDMSPEQYFEDWETLDKETKNTFVRGSWFSPMFSYVGWNELVTPFKDRRVRIALTMLFDRQEFIDKKLHGAAVPVSGTQYLFGPGYDREVAPIAYDPDAARELLQEAGWIDTDNDGILDKNGEKLHAKLLLGQGRPIIAQMCEVIQKNFKNVGIDLQIQQMEWASFVDKFRSKEFDAVTLRWAMPVESDPFQIWHSSEAAREKRGSNFISFRNAQADELIEMLRVTLDEKKRHRIHQSFHRVIDSEQPYMFLWIAKEFGAYHKRFRNVKWYRLRPGFDLSEWYVPKDEQLHK